MSIKRGLSARLADEGHASDEDEGAEDGHPGDALAEDEDGDEHGEGTLGIDDIGGLDYAEAGKDPVPREEAAKGGYEAQVEEVGPDGGVGEQLGIEAEGLHKEEPGEDGEQTVAKDLAGDKGGVVVAGEGLHAEGIDAPGG